MYTFNNSFPQYLGTIKVENNQKQCRYIELVTAAFTYCLQVLGGEASADQSAVSILPPAATTG